MTHCSNCGERIERGDNFCHNCGASIEKKMTVEAIPQQGLMSRFEQGILFRIARGFTWVILIITVISLIYYIISLVPTTMDLLGGDTKVSQDDIRKAMETRKTRRSFMFEERVQEKIDPELLAKLDKEIYELFSLLPQDIQENWNIESFRRDVKEYISEIQGKVTIVQDRTDYVKEIQEKIAIVKEAKDIIKDFSVTERVNALEKFFILKAHKVEAVKNKKERAKQKLSNNATYILMGLIFITSLSMILVLLAIERNTRKIIERAT